MSDGDAETVNLDENEPREQSGNENEPNGDETESMVDSSEPSGRKCETCGKEIPKRRGRPSRFCDEHRQAGKSVSKPRKNAVQNDSANVNVTKELTYQLFGALSFSASVIDCPVWKLNEDEVKELGNAWYPILKKYEDQIAEWLGVAVCLIPTAAILGPRIVIRTKIAKGEITLEQGMKIVGPAMAAMKDVMAGKTVTIHPEETPNAPPGQA